jgi:hypothetical protein
MAEYPGLEVEGVGGDFTRHLGELPREGRRLVAFLGRRARARDRQLGEVPVVAEGLERAAEGRVDQAVGVLGGGEGRAQRGHEQRVDLHPRPRGPVRADEVGVGPEAAVRAVHRVEEGLGLGARAGERAGALPYGQQRMLEIARALATRPRLFMLDEPAAGLNASEVEFLLERLTQINARGITLLVVEHNMDLVMNVAQRVFVMDHGEPLYEGTPREVQSNAGVVAAYLGGEFAA